jgi:Tfp pilus tip-associated adhesin PilY1
VQQTLVNDVTSAGVPVRIEPTVQPVTLPAPNRGWFVDLNLVSGERVITDPAIESGGGLVFTTYQPNTSECVGGGSAWLMVLNYATGGSFPLPELDTNSDGKLDSNDLGSTGNVPVGMSLGPVYASAVTFLPSGGGAGGTMKLTSVSSNNVDSVLDRGRAKQRISWWETRH